MKIPTYNIPIKKPKSAIHYNKFIDLLEKEKGYDTRDFAGKFNPERMNEIRREVAKQFGINPNKTSWTKSAKGRTEIENKAWDALSLRYGEIPYLDFWHWMLDGPFMDLHNGSYQYLDKYYLDNLNENQEWIKTILNDIFEACKDHPAFDDDGICFWVEW